MKTLTKINKKYVGLAIIIAGLVTGGVSVMNTSASNPGNGRGSDIAEQHVPVCPGPASEGTARCHARVIADAQGSPKASPNGPVAPSGYGPAQLRGAYGLSAASAPKKQIIAIVDAYDDPNIYADLTTYSQYYSIPVLPLCSGSVTSSVTPCFQKVDQRGGTAYPKADGGWALETSLDVEVSHAMCQNCHILLVEADSSSMNNLAAAVSRAYAMGATEISNSYGASEFSGETTFDSAYNHPGVAITASSGDNGYGSSYPAASPYVTAVGGTTLNLSGTTYVSETAWSGSGSGCSVYESRPSFQSGLPSNCVRRMIADVSAVGNPNTGAAVYDSFKYSGKSGWFKVGGTSLSAPLVAGVYALGGGVPTGTQGNALVYNLKAWGTNMTDVLSGTNGTCSVAYFCAAGSGYDGPTGLGSPKGASAF